MNLETWTDLLQRVAPAHHDAFASTDGDDPEWPAWYAAWLLERLPAPPGIDQSQLAELLSDAAADHKASGSTESWPAYYARFLIMRLQS